MSNLANDFAPEEIQAAMQTLLELDLVGVDIDCIGDKDFNEDGEVSLTPPAARILFLDESSEAIENQNLNYRSKPKFAVLCGDSDLSASPQAQRDKSLLLARRVKQSLVGARLVLPDGNTSDPILYLGMEKLPAENIGIAYLVGFEVAGVAQFPGTHAQPQGGN